MALNGAFPEFFEPLLAEQYPAQDVARILAGSETRRKTTLRANTLKVDAQTVAAALNDAGIAWTGVPWYADAFVLQNAREDAVRALPLYEQGALYLQNLSAMIPPLALGAPARSDVCDMCAAPGGKTTQILALSGGGAFVTACEMHAPRADKLEYNLQKQGAGNVTVMRTDARRLDEFFSFDYVLLDAPCSGSGTLNSADPKLARRFTPELIAKSVKSQRALMSKALDLLRPGGVLVYSTCSVLAQENEQIVEWGLQKAARKGSFELTPLPAPDFHGIPQLPTTLPETHCICPDECYEGFFVARIKRTA